MYVTSVSEISCVGRSKSVSCCVECMTKAVQVISSTPSMFFSLSSQVFQAYGVCVLTPIPRMTFADQVRKSGHPC